MLNSIAGPRTIVAAILVVTQQFVAAELSTPALAFRVTESGTVELHDKSAGVTWRSRSEVFGEVTLNVAGQFQRASLVRPTIRQSAQELALQFQPLTNHPGRLNIEVRKLADDRTLEFSYFEDALSKVESIRLLDQLLWTKADGYVVVPVREGLLIPANSGLSFTQRFDTYAYEGCHMEMFGIVKDGAAALVTWDDPYAALEVRCVTAGAKDQSLVTSTATTQVVSASLALRKSARSFRVRLLGKGDYVTIAQAYREVAREKGLLVTWDEKLKQNPGRAKYFGASNYKLWSTLSRRMNDESTKEESVRVSWTFDEAAQVAEHLKHDLKLDKVLFSMGGWIHRGYDNQHPDILPTAPECGGDAAFAKACERIRALGYVLSLHDNYQDIYRDSPSWNERWIQKNADGSLTKGGHWAGGRAYITCSRAALELARRPQNLPAVKRLSGADSYFIDTTYAAGLQECFDKDHPLTRVDDIKWKAELSDYARDVFGSFGSECGREWAIPHADFFEGLTGVSGKYYHSLDAAKLGASVIPLFELVYRDCIAMYGKYGYDPAQAAEYVLHHIAMGRPLNYHSIPSHLYWKQQSQPLTTNSSNRALFTRADHGWAEGMHGLDRFVKNTHEILSPLNEITSRTPMTQHEFLTSDRKVQHTMFDSGDEAVHVVVNASASEYHSKGRLGGEVVLPPYGFAIESPRFAAFCAVQWNGRRYTEPTLFTLRADDGQSLAHSKRIKVFHGFGDTRLALGSDVYEVLREAVIAPPPANAGARADVRAEKAHPFFPFCIDWHDTKKRTFEEQATMLKELGYDGVGHIYLDKVAERLKSLDDAGLKLFQITMTIEVGPDQKPYDARFKDVLALVNGRRVQFCLLVNGMKPSDPSVDPHAVKILREVSDLARETDAQLLLYPHQGSWIERIEDSMRVADQVDRPNVGVMFNVCHWLRVDRNRDYKPLLKEAMPRLWAVSINGADNFDEKPGWSRYIRPLDSGDFNIGSFLKTLRDLGYHGPIGLQCYGIGGDAREHLARSMVAWTKLSAGIPSTATSGSAYSELWGEGGERWSPQGRLSDFSFAGYHRGEKSLPKISPGVSVKKFGAKGDGHTDDTAAFSNALATVESGAIEVPLGRYRITSLLEITRRNVVLRGAGPDKSVLLFPTPLNEIKPNWGATTTGKKTSNYSWSGGFITVRGSFSSRKLTDITAAAQRGDHSVTVASTAGLRVGQEVEISQSDTPDNSLAVHLYSNDAGPVENLKGHARTSLIARIGSIDGNGVAFDRALRMDMRAEWKPQLRAFEPTVTESGVEELGFEFPVAQYGGHFSELGYNPVALSGVAHCWVRNVRVMNADSGPFISGVFNTVEGVVLESTRPVDEQQCTGHHGISLGGTDNLVTRCEIRTRFIHDITVSGFCSGNVVSKTRGVDLSLDHHRYAPHENLFTDLDAGAGTRLWKCGGGAALGKHCGARGTFWNIRSARSLSYPPPDFGPPTMNLVALETTQPSETSAEGKWFEAIKPSQIQPQDLHEAQLHRRLK